MTEQEKNEIRKLYIDVFRYLVFLQKTYNCSVSLHYGGTFFASQSGIVPIPEYRRCNRHSCALCEKIKSNAALQLHCLEQQRRVARAVDTMRFGMCWCGVEEYTMPVQCDGRTVAFISVSGYRVDSEKAMRRLRRAAEESGMDFTELKQRYMSLSPAPPDAETVEALLTPAVDLIAILYRETRKAEADAMSAPDTKSDTLFGMIVEYIDNNYASVITVKQLSEIFHYSESYISHTFKKRSNRSISQYVNSVRITYAQMMLREEKSSVCEIASRCGFDNASYFAAVFRKCTGMSPQEYRREHTLLKQK